MILILIPIYVRSSHIVRHLLPPPPTPLPSVSTDPLTACRPSLSLLLAFTPLFKAPAQRMFGIGNPGNWCWAIVGVVALRHVMLCLGEFKMCETFWPKALQYASLANGGVRGTAGQRMKEFYKNSANKLADQEDYSEGCRELIAEQPSTSGIKARLTCQLQQVCEWNILNVVDIRYPPSSLLCPFCTSVYWHVLRKPLPD